MQESYILFILLRQKMEIGLFLNCENQFCQLVESLGSDSVFGEQIQGTVKSAANWLVDKGSGFLASLPKAILNTFITFFSMFYFLRDGKMFFRKAGSFLGLAEEKYSLILHRLREITNGVIYGYFFVAILQGVLGGIGFAILGIPSPLFWGAVMGLLAMIPYLGTGIIWGPAALMLFLDGMFQDSTSLMVKGIGLAVYGLVIVSGLDNYLKPKIMSNKARIHPAIMMVGLFGGIFLFGPLGVFVGPFILSMTVVLMKVYFSKTAS